MKMKSLHGHLYQVEFYSTQACIWGSVHIHRFYYFILHTIHLFTSDIFSNFTYFTSYFSFLYYIFFINISLQQRIYYNRRILLHSVLRQKCDVGLQFRW